MKKVLMVIGSVIGGFFTLCVVLAAFGVGSETTPKAEAETAKVEKHETKAQPVKHEPKLEPVEKTTPEPAPKPEPAPEPTISSGQENALASAEQYLSYSGFSHDGLIEQLKFEDFSDADAAYAADHVDADWNAEAVESAKQYLDYSSFSQQGLIDQLVFEKYTPAQAEYAAGQVY